MDNILTIPRTIAAVGGAILVAGLVALMFRGNGRPAVAGYGR